MNLLLEALRRPAGLPALTRPQWDLLLRLARRERLLAHLGWLIRDLGLEDRCPPRALDQIRGHQVYVDFQQVQALREVREVGRVLHRQGIPVLLLKGAAYLVLGLPHARGRALSDLDILVPRAQVPQAEALLTAHGWVFQNLNAYDQRYYREWMHELPPLRHRERALELDLHHNILPLTGRVVPDATRLWQSAVEVDYPPGLTHRVLGPEDRLIHAAVHLAQDGDLSHGLRDLVDLHELWRQGSGVAGFPERLAERADELGLTRPVGHALYCARRLLHTPLPETLVRRLDAPVRRSLTGRLTRALALRVLRPRNPDGPGTPVAGWLLYLRSHWLRMPPLLLARHLIRKSGRRLGRPAR